MAANQDIERIYMSKLKDIETAVWILDEKKRKYQNNIRYLKIPFGEPSCPSKPKLSLNNLLAKFYLSIMFGMSSLGLYYIDKKILIHSWLYNEESSEFASWVNGTLGIIGIITFVAACVVLVKEKCNSRRKYKEELEIYEKTKVLNSAKYNENCKKAQMQESKLKNIESELKKAIDVRNELYDVNWIPNQYRNIRVIYYICDMVTSSGISIEESIKYYLLQEANNKLDLILEKMDEIIENQKQIIANQVILDSQNTKMIEQNSAMLSKASHIEENTRLAADYARIGAAYSAVNTYFSMAQYLEN